MPFMPFLAKLWAMVKAGNSNRCKICSKEEFEQFVSIYKRFKQIIKGPEQNLGDFSYKQTELVNDVREFWPKIARIVAGLVQRLGVNIAWDSDDLEVIEKVIYGDVIPFKWGPICYDDPPPFFDRRHEFNAAETKRRRRWCERYFDLIMINLCKHFGLKKEVIAEESDKSRTRKEQEWQPPKNHISSKQIVNEHRVPRTTLQGWQERDIANGKFRKVVKDPQTQENYYPQNWFEKRLKSYKPRQQT